VAKPTAKGEWEFKQQLDQTLVLQTLEA